MLGALVASVRTAAGEDGVARVLQAAGERRAAEDFRDPTGWSTYEQGVSLFRAAAEVLGDPDIGRKAGVELLRRYAGSEVLTLLRSLGSPAEMLRMYPAFQAKQSTVTRSEVVEVGEDHGSISVTSVPPIQRDALFCGYTLGVLSQLPVVFGMQPASVHEPECQTRGSGRCLFEIAWDPSSAFETGAERELASLREQVDVLTTRFESIEAVASELSTARDVDSMLETIIHHARVAVRAPRYVLAVRLPGEAAPRVHSFGVPESEAFAVADALLSDLDPHGDPTRLVVDIASSRTHFGRLVAFYPEGFHFLPQERSMLVAYAGHAAAALETAAALEESRERNATLGSLLALARTLAQVHTSHEVAESVAEALPALVGCDHACVLLWNADDALLARAAVSHRTGAPARRLPPAMSDERVAGRMLESSEPISASPTSDEVVQGVLTLTGLTHALMVPLVARDEFLGVVVAGSADVAVESSEPVRERLAGVGSLASTALDGVKLVDEVRYQALHDPTTDLPNGRLFEDRVSYAIAVARRSGSSHGLLFVDLDRFKTVNDSHGHKVGDDLLRAAAHRLCEVARESDTVARLGGDEFGLLLQGAGGDDARTVAEKVVAALSAPFEVRGLVLRVGASVGVTTLPLPGDTYECVLARADSAMYEAKSRGRGRVRLYRALPQDAPGLP